MKLFSMPAMLLVASTILVGCGKDKVVYDNAQPSSSFPSINVTIDNTANGGAVNDSGNSTNDNNQSQSNVQTTNVSQTTTVNVENELEFIAAVLGGRIYESPLSSRGLPRCRSNEHVKTNKHGQYFCVKPPKPVASKAGLKCNLYDLAPTKPSKLPNFSTMQPVFSFVADQLDVADQNYAGGFPKINDASVRSTYLEWYGVRCIGKLAVAKADNYTFYLTADDGAILTLDAAKIIDNDGLHSPLTKSATGFISKGSHDIQVDYFQGPRTQIALVLEWAAPTMTRTVVNKSLFTH